MSNKAMELRAQLLEARGAGLVRQLLLTQQTEQAKLANQEKQVEQAKLANQEQQAEQAEQAREQASPGAHGLSYGLCRPE